MLCQPVALGINYLFLDYFLGTAEFILWKHLFWENFVLCRTDYQRWMMDGICMVSENVTQWIVKVEA